MDKQGFCALRNARTIQTVARIYILYNENVWCVKSSDENGRWQWNLTILPTLLATQKKLTM